MPKKVSLKQLRQEHGLTQTEIAKQIAVSQESISRMENQLDNSDIGKLSSYVRELGGELQLVVQFPDNSSVILSNQKELQEPRNMQKTLTKEGIISHRYTDPHELRGDIASLLVGAPIPKVTRVEKWLREEEKPLQQSIKEHFDYWEKKLGLKLD